MAEQKQSDLNRSSSLSVSEWSTASSASTRSKQPHDRDRPMRYNTRHQLQSGQDPTSMELAHRSHRDHPPHHAEASVYRHGSTTDNESHYKFPSVHPQHLQEPSTNALVHPHAMAQLSPNFHSRSSPIAIMHNPEDSVNKAKLRWQHPMYDTSDDEDDEDAFMQGGISVEALTSPLEGPPSGGAPKSLPTALLRAPKLGSLPSQDYRLLHLATLPPPMSLNADSDAEMGVAHFDNAGHQGPKPRFLSSYGSLRESHLTGRFGSHPGPRVQVAASTGQLPNPDTRSASVQIRALEPPATLIPPRNPAPQPPPPPIKNYSNPSPPKKQPPAAPLSIRDRMMQKAQQQKEEAVDQPEKKKAASSLSAMLANDDNNLQNSINTDSQDHRPSFLAAGETPEHKSSPRRSSRVLPPSMANAVAISYNSNLNLFADARRRSQHEEERNGEQESTSMMLSSSMTGLEVLRAASKASSSVRPTSLNILQSVSRTVDRPPPPVTVNGPPTFMQMSRSLSEPHPPFPGFPPQQNTVGVGVMQSSSLAEEAPSYYNIPGGASVIRTADGRTLIQPQSFRSPTVAVVSTFRTNQSQPTSSLHPQPPFSQDSRASAMPWVETNLTPPMISVYGSSAQVEESNPDTQGAFDMDLE